MSGTTSGSKPRATFVRNNVVRKIERALISVYDKKGIVEFARGLAALHVEILATGSTSKLLSANGIRVREVADYTGFPEILDGKSRDARTGAA